MNLATQASTGMSGFPFLLLFVLGWTALLIWFLVKSD